MRSSGSVTEGAPAPGRAWRRAGTALFSLALLAAAAWFFADRWPEVAARLRRVPAGVLPPLALAALANFWLVAQRNRVQLIVSGVRVGGLEIFALTVCNSMLNYLPARGGAAFLAVYLKQRHRFPIVRFLLLAGVVLPLYAGTSAAFAGALLLVNGAATGTWHPGLTAGLLAGALLAPAGLLVAHLLGRVRLPERLARLQRWIAHAEEGAAAFRSRPGSLPLLAGIYLSSLLVFALRSWMILRAIGHPAPFLALCVVQAIVEISTLVALTPGNLGVREALSVLSASLIGIPAEPMMATALLDRAVTMTLVFPLGALFGQLLTRIGPPAAPAGGGAKSP